MSINIKNKKLIAFVFVTGLAVVLGAFYYLKKDDTETVNTIPNANSSTNPSTPEVINQQEDLLDKTKWQTLNNTKYGYSIKHPSNLVIRDKYNEAGINNTPSSKSSSLTFSADGNYKNKPFLLIDISHKSAAEYNTRFDVNAKTLGEYAKANFVVALNKYKETPAEDVKILADFEDVGGIYFYKLSSNEVNLVEGASGSDFMTGDKKNRTLNYRWLQKGDYYIAMVWEEDNLMNEIVTTFKLEE